MIIPGFLITLVTFPGVIVHEAAHMLFCRWFGLAVFDVCFVQMQDPAGYVIHEPARNFRESFFVSMGPFFVNSALCILFCLGAFLPVHALKVSDGLPYFFAWLGLSIGMHAFPSSQDLSNVYAAAGTAVNDGNILAILSYPLIGILYLLNFARFFWIDLLYGVAIGFLVPLAVFRALIQ